MTESLDDLKQRVKLLESALASAGVPLPAGQARPSRGLVLGLVAFVAAFGAVGYAWRIAPTWTSASNEQVTEPAAAASSPHALAPAEVDAMLASLAARLKARPDDLPGWRMLGRTQAVLGRFAEAVAAYRHALSLRADDAQTLADLADALAMQQGRSFDGEPERLIQKALLADPDNLKALSLAGALAYERQDVAGALRHWERVLQLGEPGNELVQLSRENVEEARQRLGLPPATAQAAPTAAGAIHGHVDLAPALKRAASPDDTVFIYARAAQGSRMPLAILQKQVRELPTDFTLDDSLAMDPAHRLSSAQAVIVSARVSRSGQATAQPGDLQGLSQAVKPGSTDVRIVIGEVVR